MFKKVVENSIISAYRSSSAIYPISLNKMGLFNPILLQSANVRTNCMQLITKQQSMPIQEESSRPIQVSKEDLHITNEVISQVNSQIKRKAYHRLFAVVNICGKQFKITDEDLIIIEGYWPPTVGDKLQLEKVLLVGSTDFTLVGQPILSRELVSVQATVIEKTLSHIKTHFRKKRRKQYMRINFHRSQFTMLRITSIELTDQVNKKFDENEERIF